MNKKYVIWSLVRLLVLGSMLLSACGAPAPPVATEAPAATAVVTEAPAVIVGAVSGSAANPAVQVMNAEMEKRAAELGVTRMLKLQKVLKNKSKKRTH